MKDRGLQAYFHRDGLFLCQEKYATDLLINAGMKDCSPMPTPLPLQLDKLQGQHELFSDPTCFRSLAGKLQYLTLTRPDIQFSVNYVYQKMHQPTVSDFQLLKRLLRYVKSTVRMGINLYSNSASNLTAFSDSDYAGCKDTRRSTGGFCTFLGTNIIYWSAKRHPTASKSSTEAEYQTMSEVASEMKWISSLLRNLGIAQPDTLELFCDNLSAIYLSANPTLHNPSKHFDTDFHYVRERVSLGTLVVKHIPTHSRITYVFTKSLPQQPFCALRSKLGVCLPPNTIELNKRREVGLATKPEPTKSVPQTLHQDRGSLQNCDARTVKSVPQIKLSTTVKPAPQIKLNNRYDCLLSQDAFDN
ncbi:PREDICTED: uncharacterized protein LOC109130896 [Camelina sativa]|uniref:Uncharacterized protein LOC109130896 n=1 Tax=Camelina sativa TaxID=90675 RepID=A0ABM1RBZ5_CAMSA|nr:PREDICTED: uncharacterized protein LOC109130896 [Camelina sativa]